jgi:hypothetical protein
MLAVDAPCMPEATTVVFGIPLIVVLLLFALVRVVFRLVDR